MACINLRIYLFVVSQIEIENPLIELVIGLHEYFAEEPTLLLGILHHLERLLVVLLPLRTKPQGLDHNIVEFGPDIRLHVQNHL